MGNKQKVNKKSQQGSPKAPAQPPGGGPAGRAAVASDSDGTLASFFKSALFLVLASVFIVLMIAAAWFLDQRWLEIVVLAVVLLAGVVVVVFWLRKKPEARLLNETHDRHDDFPEKPQEEFGSSLITQTPSAPPSQAAPVSMGGENTPWAAEIQHIKDVFRSFAKKVDGLELRLAELEQERQDRYYQNPKPVEERRPVVAAPAPPPQKRPAPTHHSYQEARPHPIDLSSVNQAVCRFLADQSGGWDIERLVQSVRGSMDGNSSIDVEHLGSHSSGEWRV
ncbi:MAG TPA: hypothetical protein VK899_00490, partial [Gemmatimonadales bacterium]|nr:hypothetical protein [Gemmatimonadales bacterium]